MMGEWKLIETAPKGRIAVLVYRADNRCAYTAVWNDELKTWVHFGMGAVLMVGGEVTHWMPLPEPPEQESE
jgi:hypothetical protein